MDGRIWRTERADRFSVVVDAERYFEVAREALLQARSRIMLVGWDFDARIRLSGDERGEDEPPTVGEFLYWLVERTPTLELYLLRWDVGALKSLFRGSTILTVMKWMRHPRIGSTNINNRSMGLDSECDVLVEGGENVAAAAAGLRDGLLAEHLSVGVETVGAAVAKHGLIGAVEALRCDGRSLRPYELPELGAGAKWLADGELLDSESPAEMFEPASNRGLFRRAGSWMRSRR